MAHRSLTTAWAMRGLGRRILRPLRDAGHWPPYLLRRLLGRPAGDLRYQLVSGMSTPRRVEVQLPAEGDTAITEQDAAAWCARQTLTELTAVGYDRSGRPLWRAGVQASAEGTEASWFAAPSRLPEVEPAFLESAALVAGAEEIDAVALIEGVAGVPEPRSPADLLTPALRPFCLFSGDAYRYQPAADEIEPTIQRQLVKAVPGGPEPDRDATTFNARRRGSYLSSSNLPPRLHVGVRGTAPPKTSTPAEIEADTTRVLVTVPFLARGGAEHTLFETLRAMGDFEISIATLAPHRLELGDRRRDFQEISGRIYCLGDLVHPAAMPGILGGLLDRLQIDVVYNANSTTLFYELFPRLEAERPGLRIVDHLYDHRIGYIERYADPALLDWIDACVAENRRIAEVLAGELGWPDERVPVIWPCGRTADAFPKDLAAARREVRQELGLDDSDVIFLTAARMHEQKRPLDLVALAQRVRDLEGIQFLLVGGGDLETRVDAAIAAAGDAPIRRLPFRTDIPRLIAAADVGCLISEHEGLPVFMLECLQAGRPFLGTDAGEMAAVLADTCAGVVTGAPGDLDAIEAAVRRLYDPDARAELARRAADAGGLFDVESCAARYAEVLRGSRA